MFNYFHYRGVCSLDLGVLVSDAEPWTTKVTPETVTIPGRGDALLGYEYSNSDAVYNIIIRKTGRDTLTDAVERVRRWLLPDVDYSPLRDSYNPGYYRRAYLPGGLAVTRDGLHEAVATVTFSTMPFKYADGGDTAIQARNGLKLYNRETYEAAPLLKITGTGAADIFIGSHALHVKEIGGLVYIDTEDENAFDDAKSRNSDITRVVDWPRLSPGETVVQYDGAGITGVEISYTKKAYPSGSITVYSRRADGTVGDGIVMQGSDADSRIWIYNAYGNADVLLTSGAGNNCEFAGGINVKGENGVNVSRAVSARDLKWWGDLTATGEQTRIKPRSRQNALYTDWQFWKVVDGVSYWVLTGKGTPW